MSIFWFAFLLITGRILATSTLFADRFAVATLRSRRFIWTAGLILTTTWPAIAFGVLRLVRRAAAHGLAFTSPGGGLPMQLHLARFAAPAWVDQTCLILWACASAALIARLVLGVSVLRRWRRSLPVIGVDGVQVRLSPIAGPAVIGFWTAELMIPAWVLALDQPARALVIRHEQEHIATSDARLLWLAALLPALVPWNVFSWWQASRLRLAVEMDCDARVLRHDPRPVEYATLLVAIAERWSQGARMPLTVPTLARSPRWLEYRLAAIGKRQANRQRSIPIVYASVSLIALGAAFMIEMPAMPWLRATPSALVGPHAFTRMPYLR